MEKVGEGKLRYAVWDVYYATLLSRNGHYKPDKPLALKLRYLRDIKKKRLIKETHSQWKKLGMHNHKDVPAWLDRLDSIWSDVSENDTITLFINEQQHAHFYLNDDFIGNIDDPEFSRCFASIWLAPGSSRPRLRDQLVGAN